MKTFADYFSAKSFDSKRKDGEPAPLRCEGKCKEVTMHVCVSYHQSVGHDLCKCVQCEHVRIWG